MNKIYSENVLTAAGDDDDDGAKIYDFRSSLNRFAYTESTLRRSPRKHPRLPTALKVDQGSTSKSVSTRKRPSSLVYGSDDKTTVEGSPKKGRRGYATPDTYAHLNYLQDYLAEELDVIFCGINPGYRSAEVGHHFANPTNHFWRCLHQSGFTPRLLDPSQDFTLPKDFRLGVTNLVDRPSTQQSELSSAEMSAAVPAFLAKVSRFRPRVVCFVGLGMWQIVQQTLSRSVSSFPRDDLRPNPPGTRKTRGSSAKVGLQPYKLVYSPRKDPECLEKLSVAETLIFASPCTSGRVVSHQLSDKIAIFTALNRCVENLKQGRLNTDEMVVVPVDNLFSMR